MPRLPGLLRRLVLACTALAMLATGPAMAAGMRPVMEPAAGHHQHGGHPGEHAPRPHRHGQCCDLCVVHCGSPFGSAQATRVPLVAPAPILGLAAPADFAAVVTRARYRLPPALAPPTLLD